MLRGPARQARTLRKASLPVLGLPSTVAAFALRTAFPTPPGGWAHLFLRGVAPPEIRTRDIYLGVIPFIGMQVLTVVLVFMYPQIALWLPKAIGW